MSTRQRVYLVIGADRRIRAAKRPQIRADEIAIAIDLTFPGNWGRVQPQSIAADVPDFAPEAVISEGAAS